MSTVSVKAVTITLYISHVDFFFSFLVVCLTFVNIRPLNTQDLLNYNHRLGKLRTLLDLMDLIRI